MSIFGATGEERRRVLAEDILVCDDCGYDGPDHNRQWDICNICGANMPSGEDDHCAECGASNCLMMACPECAGRLSLDYEILQPKWDARAAFRRYVRAEARLTPEEAS